MAPIKISCAIIVKNGAATIERCLKSLQGSVDEIVLVDTGSTDNTLALALKYTNHIYHFDWIDDFSAARNFSLSKCSGDWIFVIDADEYLTEAVRSKLTAFVNAHPDAVGKIAQLNTTLTPEGPQSSQCVLTRFFPKGLAFTGRIHEQVETDRPRLFTGIAVGHDGYLADNKVARNRVLLELELEENPKDPYLLFQVGKQYFIEKNYAQATSYYAQALAVAPAASPTFSYLVCDLLFCHMKLSRWPDGITLIQAAYDLMSHLADFHFTCANFYMEAAFADPNSYQHLIGLIPDCYQLCLSIGEAEGIDRIVGTGSYLAAYNLAAYYEALGDANRAKSYYEQASAMGYQPAKAKLSQLDSYRH